MTELSLPIIIVFIFFYLTVIRRIGFLTADSMFACIQLLMALGSLPLLDPARPADHLYGYILVYTIICFMLVSAVLHARLAQDGRKDRQIFAMPPDFNIRVLLVISVLVMALYFRAVGYSALLSGLQGNGSDVASLRLDSYSGSRYLFPGYVNQFKNSLLPSLVIVVLTYWANIGKSRKLVGAMLVGIASFGLLGTGQRGAFVMFSVIAVVYIKMLDSEKFPKRAAIALGVAVPLVLLSTIVLGRGPVVSGSDSGFFAKTASAVSQFQYRIVGSNQDSAVAGFRYIYDKPVQNGREWGQALLGLLPGNRGSNLANRIYETMFGTDRGTAPPSIWGSIYHNFGLGGIVIGPIFLALLCGFLTRRGATQPERNTMELVGMAGTFTVLGFWAAGDPTFLFNTGIVVYLLLWRWGGRIRRSSPRQTTQLAFDGGEGPAVSGPSPLPERWAH